MAEDDGHASHPHASGRFDEGALPEGNGLGPHQSGIPRPPGEGDGYHGVDETGAQSGGDGNGQKERREGQEHVGDAHYHLVQPAPKVASQGPQGRPDAHCDYHHQEADGKRTAPPEEHPSEDIAAEVVGAEGVLP